jgi:hypothetical protein
MPEPDILDADDLVDDADITDEVEDDDPEANEGEEVTFDLGDDANGGV